MALNIEQRCNACDLAGLALVLTGCPALCAALVCAWCERIHSPLERHAQPKVRLCGRCAAPPTERPASRFGSQDRHRWHRRS